MFHLSKQDEIQRINQIFVILLFTMNARTAIANDRQKHIQGVNCVFIPLQVGFCLKGWFTLISKKKKKRQTFSLASQFDLFRPCRFLPPLQYMQEWSELELNLWCYKHCCFFSFFFTFSEQQCTLVTKDNQLTQLSVVFIGTMFY